MSIQKSAAVLLVAMMGIGAAYAQTENLLDWGKGPAQYLMTKDEAKQWKSIKDDSEARAFIDLFWARRDPTPATPANEAKAQFEQNVAFANKNFAYAKLEGAATDRGRIFITLGRPSKIKRSNAQARPVIEEGFVNNLEKTVPSEIWIYEEDHVSPALKKAGFQTMQIVFSDEYGSGEYKLEPSPKTNVKLATQIKIDESIVSPKLTKAPEQVAAAPAAAPAVAPPITTELTTEAYQAAIAAFKADAKPTKGVYFHYMEEITPEGVHYVPVMLYVTPAAGVTAGPETSLFGVIEDATGKRVAVIEESAKLIASKDDLFVDKSLTLAPGKYKAIIGIGAAGQAVAITSSELEVKGLDQAAPGVDRLIISNNVFALTAAQLATDPYAFGGLKVIPKGDRVFTTADELTFFYVMRNPGVDETSAPKVQVKVDVAGEIKVKDAKGKEVKQTKRYSLPLTDAEVAPVKDTPGHFQGGQSVPLTSFKPGEYTLKVKLIDNVSKAEHLLEEHFTVVVAAAPAPAPAATPAPTK